MILQMGGLFGVPSGRGLFDRERGDQQVSTNPIERFFSGRRSPALTAEQNRQASRDAFLSAGLAILLRSRQTKDLLPLIAEGALTGQAVGAGSRQLLQTQQARAQVAQLLLGGGGTPSRDQLTQAATMLALSGDQESAAQIINLLKEQPEVEKPAIVQVVTPDGKLGFGQRIGEGPVKLLRGTRELPANLEAGNALLGEDELGRQIALFEAVPRDVKTVEAASGETIVFDPLAAETGRPREIGRIGEPDRGEANQATLDLRKEFRADKEVQAAQVIGDMLLRARSVTDTTAGDQSLVVILNKILDPNSVVRESEFARVADMGGLEARAQRWKNFFLENGRFPSSVREQIKQEIESLAEAAARQFTFDLDQWTRVAQSTGADPSLVLENPFSQVADVTGRSVGPFGRSRPDGRVESVEDIFRQEGL